MKTQTKKKVAFIWPNFGPHHIARMNALSKYTPGIVGIEISKQQIIYPWQSDRERLAFPITTLFEKPYEKISFQELANRIIAELASIVPDVVVLTGLTDSFCRETARWAKSNHMKVVISMASWAGIKKRSLLKEWLKSVLYRRYADAMVCTGILSKQYANDLGFSDDRIWTSGNALMGIHYEDNAQLIREVRNVGPQLAFETFFIYVGRFSPEKNILRLIQAHEKYCAKGGRWGLVLVGDGKEREKVRTSLSMSTHSDRIHILNWLAPADLIGLYASASCLILPSVSETWGLVAQEAMLRGLPILLSDKCGCVPEFCIRGVNGYSFDPFDINRLSELMGRMSASDENARKMGQHSVAIARRFTLDMWARAWADCINDLI